MHTPSGQWLNLPNIGMSLKVLFTGYLLVVGLGLLMAGGQILLTHGMADAKLGLSVDDVVYSYYGNRGSSKLEAKLNGSMKDKASTHDRTEIIKWVRDGTPVAEWEPHIEKVFQANCIKCHGVIPGLPDFNSFENVKRLAAIDTGATVDSLTRVSHIHLFGIAFIFFFIGLIFSLAIGIPKWLKWLAIALPFAFLIIDVLSWWLTKFHPGFAWMTIIAGFSYSMASAFMWFMSMYQMWVLPFNGKEYTQNAWLD